MNDQQEQFKKVGGDVKWLQSIKYAPKKIQNLSEINKILAHQPWTLTKEHIEVRVAAFFVKMVFRSCCVKWGLSKRSSDDPKCFRTGNLDDGHLFD